MKKLGVALGGGGMRGAAHIGVLQVLQENRVNIDSISGTSAGSIFAALYACGVSPWDMEKIALSISPGDYLDYNWWGFFCQLLGRPLIKQTNPFEGFIKGDRMENLMKGLTGGKSLRDCSMPVAIVSCDINSGRKVVFSNHRPSVNNEDDLVLVEDAYLYEAVRASCSIPAVFIPFYFRDMQLVDGGVSEMVPVIEQRAIGVDYIMAVNLGSSEYDTSVKGIVPVVTRSLEILEYGTSILAENLFAQMVIFPKTKEVALDDVSQVEVLIRSGRRAMKAQIDQLLRELAG